MVPSFFSLQCQYCIIVENRVTVIVLVVQRTGITGDFLWVYMNDHSSVSLLQARTLHCPAAVPWNGAMICKCVSNAVLAASPALALSLEQRLTTRTGM